MNLLSVKTDDMHFESADKYFPAFHPRMHTAHNNDPNGPLFFNNMYHLFMQQKLPWNSAWNGGIGWPASM